METLQTHSQMANGLVPVKPSQKADHYQKEVRQKLESIS